MKVIIAGSRGITRYSLVEKAVVASKFTITQVVIAVWDGFSGGTKHMMQCMGKRAKPIYYIDLDL